MGEAASVLESPILSEAYVLDPLPVIARLRREDPVHFVPGIGLWMVTSYDDVRRLFTAAAGHPQVASAGGGPILTADVSFVQVTIDWALKKVQSTIRDSAIAAIVAKVSPDKVGPIMSILKAAGTISKLDDLDQKLRTLLQKLADLEECAKNPTNPLTIKQYQQDPAAKDRILQDIAEARDELINNTIVAELGVLNGAIASLGPKWLGYVIGPGTDWAKATLQEINQERVDQIDREVTKCDCLSSAGQGGGTGGGTSGGGTSGGGTGGGSSGGGTSGGGSGGQTCQFPFTFTGTVDYSIERDGVVVFTAHATGVTWKLMPESGGGISSYELVSGTVSWAYHTVRQDGDCTLTVDGSGTEPVAPNEEATGGGEAAGPIHSAEGALLQVHWVDVMDRPTPFYIASGHVRLHAPIHWVDCHNTSEFDFEQLDARMNNWFQTPSVDPLPVLKQDTISSPWTMSGTWTYSVTPYTSTTWSWDLTSGD